MVSQNSILNTKNLKPIDKTVIRRKLKLKYNVSARVDLYDELTGSIEMN